MTGIQPGSLLSEPGQDAAGNAWTFDSFLVNLDSASGTIRISAYRVGGGLEGFGSGSLLTIGFHVKDNAPAGAAAVTLQQAIGDKSSLLGGSDSQGNDFLFDVEPRPGFGVMGTITVQAPALAPALPAAAGAAQQPLGDSQPAVAVLADVPVGEVSAPVGAEAGAVVVHEARVSEGTAVRPPAESEVAAATTVREARISDSSVLRALLSNVTVTFNALLNPEGVSALPRERGAVVDGVRCSGARRRQERRGPTGPLDLVGAAGPGRQAGLAAAWQRYEQPGGRTTARRSVRPDYPAGGRQRRGRLLPPVRRPGRPAG